MRMVGVVKKRSFIRHIRPAIAYDYYITGMTMKTVSYKYGISVSAVKTATDLYSKNEIKNLYNNNESVILVPEKRIDEAIKVLKGMGIDYRLASKDHELIEKYESKI